MSRIGLAELKGLLEKERAQGFTHCCDSLGVGYADLLALVEAVEAAQAMVRDMSGCADCAAEEHISYAMERTLARFDFGGLAGGGNE